MQSSQKKKQRYRQLFKTFKDESLVPIIVTSDSKSIKLEKPLLFAIDPDSSVRYFKKTVAKKLEYIGAIKSPKGQSEDEQLFFYCRGNQLTAQDLTMGDVYEAYKEIEGWLEIKIHGHSAF